MTQTADIDRLIRFNECLEKIRTLDPEAKVLIVSGYAADDRLEVALQCGAKGFIRKPFHTRMLLETIRKTIDER